MSQNAFKDFFFSCPSRVMNVDVVQTLDRVALRWQARPPLTVCIWTVVGVASRDAVSVTRKSSCPRSATRAQLSTTTSTGKVFIMAQRLIRRAVTRCAPRWPSPVTAAGDLARRRAAGHGFLACAPLLFQCWRSNKPLFWTSSNAQSLSSLHRCNVVGAIWNGTARCTHEETENRTRRTRPEEDGQATCTSLIA